jgi:hypothetical protein
MATQFIVTPEIIASIKELAIVGLSKEEIAERFNRDRNTVFYNNTSEDILYAINSAYNEGKQLHKEKLLKNMQKLADCAESEDVQFKATKYNLAVLHKVVEKQEIDTTVTMDVNKAIADINAK